MISEFQHPAISEEPIVYATFGARLGAALIDGLIVGGGFYTLIYMITGEVFIYDTNIRILSIIVGWLYSALQESGPAQATVGKRAVNIKVTAMNGQRISFGTATGRHFGKIISTIILCFGYFMMLWDEKNQTLHDKMAGTLVVKKYT